MNPHKKRFIHHAQVDPQLSFFVFTTEWEMREAASISDESTVMVKQGIVSYPSGEILCLFGPIRDLPEGVFYMDGPVYIDGTSVFDRKKLVSSSYGVRVFHGLSESQQGHSRTHYSTSIENLTTRKIRVTKFAPLLRNFLGRIIDKGDGYYSPRQFREWFRVADPDGWIDPGATVRDPDNYGTGSGLWAFFFEDEDGVAFIAAAPLEYKN